MGSSNFKLQFTVLAGSASYVPVGPARSSYPRDRPKRRRLLPCGPSSMGVACILRTYRYAAAWTWLVGEFCRPCRRVSLFCRAGERPADGMTSDLFLTATFEYNFLPPNFQPQMQPSVTWLAWQAWLSPRSWAFFATQARQGTPYS